MNDADIIQEFLIESNEMLSRLDQEIVELEAHPEQRAASVDSVFRTMHTIKGSSGLLGFSAVERVTHAAESLLSKARAGTLELNEQVISVILAAMDAVKRELAAIEASGAESGADWADLAAKLDAAASGDHSPSPDECRASPAKESRSLQQDPKPDAVPPEVEPQHGPKAPGVAESTIRVDVGLLDRLMNLVGELVLARNQILQFSNRQDDAVLNATSQRLSRITTELQESVMKTRMQPIGVVWNKLPRLVRDLSHSCGKRIRLEMEGSTTDLDKTIIEAIKDPLTHLIRNCCDHGIETPADRTTLGKPAHGTISLRAYHEGGQVNIEISDDGAGIDVRKVKEAALRKGLLTADRAEYISDRDAANLVFLPGFSTAGQVTNVSGRGVGMDVVRANIEKIGGIVDLVNRPGQGLTIKVKIPPTLAIIPGLVVTTGGSQCAREERFVIPQASLVELIRLERDGGGDGIETIHGARFYRRRGRLLPVVSLSELLGLDTTGDPAVINIVVLQAEDKQFGLMVDLIGDTQEIVVKPLGKQLKALECYAGSTIMGDGAVALILDISGIAKMSGLVAEEHDQPAAAKKEAATSAPEHRKQAVLLFSAGERSRIAVPLSRVARLEEFPQRLIERAAGHRVVQYRGELLQLASLAPLLDPSYADTAGQQDPVQAVVFEDGGRRVGLLVDRIVDIVEDELKIGQTSDAPCLLGSAVVAGKVADFIDLDAVLRSTRGGSEPADGDFDAMLRALTALDSAVRPDANAGVPAGRVG